MLNDLKWSLLASVGRYVLQTSAIIILARFIKPESFGIFSAILALTTVVFYFCQAGMVNLIVTCREDELKTIFFQVSFLSVLLIFILFFIVVTFSYDILYFMGLNEDSKLLLFLLVFNVFLKIMYIPFESLFVRKKKFKNIAYIEFFTFGFGYFFTSIIAGFYGLEVFALVLAVLCQSFLSLIIYTYLIFSRLGRKFAILNMEGLKKTWSKSFVFSYFQVMSSLSGQVDNVFVAKYMGVEVLGLYSRAYQLMVVPCNFFGLVVGRVFLTGFKGVSKINEYVLKKRIGLSLLFTSLSANFVCLVICLFGKEVISILLGEKWLGIYMPLLILSLSIFPRLVYKINEPILLGNNSEKYASYISAIYLFILVVFMFLFKAYGINMICLGIVLSTYIYSILSSSLICFIRRELIFIYLLFFFLNLTVLSLIYEITIRS